MPPEAFIATGMQPTTVLRIEGGAVLAGALGTYVVLDGPLWLLLVVFLAPDLSMLAYLAGPEIGSLGYNAVHTYVGPLVLAVVGIWGDLMLAVHIAAIWAAHIGADRLAGYGLKYESGFKDTHLGTQSVPASAFEDA